jgi:glycosidase
MEHHVRVHHDLSIRTTENTMKNSAEQRLASTNHPLVYEVNARVLLRALEEETGEQQTLGDIPDSVLNQWEDLGFDAIWMMGVWTPSAIGVEIARTHEGLQQEYKRTLPDWSAEDVAGSPYAVKSYTVPPKLGGDQGLIHLRKRLRERGMALFLDFVPNHTARDHHWVGRHPEFYINGATGDATRQPAYYFVTGTDAGESVLAYGRDPNYPGWTDTAQLNIFNPATRRALVVALQKIASMCDGVRCDMAMLLLNEVFRWTWHDRTGSSNEGVTEEFWAEAIATIKAEHPAFLFIAEAYWDKEWQLQQLGFDFTYDKKMYERLSREGAASVYDHLKAEMEYQRRSVRFIENHDEQRAAQAFSPEPWHRAAATVMLTVPGMVLLHEGQLDGRRVKLPVQLNRRPAEEEAPHVRAFYERLLTTIGHPVFRKGTWELLRVKPAWYDNFTSFNFLAYMWRLEGEGTRLIVVNYAPHIGQCYIELNLEGIKGASIEFRDLLGPASYVRERNALMTKGMYFDLPGYAVHVFDIMPHGMR